MSCLILVDIQNDFLPGGSLAVGGGDEILPTVHKLVADDQFKLIVASKDWHPKGHVSFASTWGAELFSARQVPKLHGEETVAQVMWPDHCVQGSHGSEIEQGLQATLNKLDKVKYVEKGTDTKIDSYSAFADNEYSCFTSMAQVLHAHGIENVHIVGLATDYCVRATAIDACKFRFKTTVHASGVRAVDPSKQESVFAELEQWGCVIQRG